MITKDKTFTQCPSVHGLGGMKCIRHAGHDGRCWNAATRTKQGTITRGEWYSKDGKFVKHHQYATRYPANAQR